MKQWIKYVLVGLIFFILGGSVVFFVDHHTKIMQQKDPLSKIETVVKEQAEKKEEKSLLQDKTTDPPKTSDQAHKDPTPNSDKKDAPADQPDKTKGAEDRDESVEYLRSLWPVKKRKAANLSGAQKGPLYLNGTSPYGPPPAYKEDIMKPAQSLKVEGTPTPPTPLPPLKQVAEIPRNQAEQTMDRPSQPLYQIQIGTFSSLDKAIAAKNVLMREGYRMQIYYQGDITQPDWFVVRMEKTFFEPQAYQQAQEVARIFRITPAVVAFDPSLPHLK